MTINVQISKRFRNGIQYNAKVGFFDRPVRGIIEVVAASSRNFNLNEIGTCKLREGKCRSVPGL